MDASAYVEAKPNRNIPAFRVGDTVRVHITVVEGERRRIQAFEGVVIRIKKGGINSNFTVRRVAHGVGVERVFPYFTPLIDKVEVTRVGKVRRSRLYFLRDRIGKAARLKPGSRSRFESLTNRPYAEEPEEVEELIEEVEDTIEDVPADEAEATGADAAEPEQTAEEAAQTEETITSEGGEPPAEAPEPEPAKAIVEEPATPEAADIEETIETELGEEPGEATGDK